MQNSRKPFATEHGNFESPTDIEHSMKLSQDSRRWIVSAGTDFPSLATKLHPLPKGLEPLGKRRKVCCRDSDTLAMGPHFARAGAPSARSERPARAERAGARESLGRSAGEPRLVVTTEKLGIKVNQGKPRYFYGRGKRCQPVKVNPSKSKSESGGVPANCAIRVGCGLAGPFALALLLLAAFVCAFAPPAHAQTVYENYTFSTFAGPGGSGWFDGSGSAAHFFVPAGIARDTNGNLYLADSDNHTIRKITPDGLVTTLAGLAGSSGTNDGIGAAARFNSPYGVAVGGDGTIYVADANNHAIRKISPSGVVSTIAGLAGTPGKVNGTGSAARFRFPRGIVVDSSNNLYVADTSNDAIRKITPAGVVSTFAGSLGNFGTNDATGTSAGFNLPVGLTMDAAGNIYVADFSNKAIRKITPAAVVTTLAGAPGSVDVVDGTNTTAHFGGPFGITLNGMKLYVTDESADAVREITLDGVVTTIAGTISNSGYANAIGTNAVFNGPSGIVADGETNLFVVDSGNDSIREISPNLTVTLFAGPGAPFNAPGGSAFGPDGNLYVADQQNHAIRKITPQGDVSTFAGTFGVSGTNDGVGTVAQFNSPVDLAFDPAGNMYVADRVNDTIRMITPGAVVSTLAGLPQVSGTNNGVGTNALFHLPTGIVVDAQTNIYVADTFNHAIRIITPDGTVSTFAGTIGTAGTTNGTGLSAQFSFPEGITIDPDGNLFVVDNGDHTIREITPGGVESTFAGSSGTSGSADGVGTAAQFSSPSGIAIDANRNLYVADGGNQAIRKITPAASVTTLGGDPGQFGNLDGTGSNAQFNGPEGVTLDTQGNLFVSDTFNNRIRKAYPALPDVPIVDLTNVDTGMTNHFSISNETTTSWSWTLVRQPSTSTNQIIGGNTDTPTFTPDVEDVYIIQFQGLDSSGHSAIGRMTIHAKNGNKLTVLAKGGGTVKPNLNGSHLQIGTVYSMTAKAVPGSTFSNWMAIIGTNAPFVFTNSPDISFVMQNDLTLIANFHDHQNPTLVMTSPKSKQFASNAVFTATGTAKDNDSVVTVWYQLNGGAWTNATGTTNWLAQVALNPGGNTILAYAQDPSGNVSTTNHAALTYVPSARLSITGTGAGFLSPNYVGALLAIGTNYSITAKPAAGYIFSNWVDSVANVTITNPVLKFTMQSNSALVVHFTRDMHYFAQGQYAGLFYDTNNLTATNAGFFSAALTSSSAFTAKLLLGGSSISASGQFSADGVFSSSFPTKNLGPINLQLQLDLTGQGIITGTVSGNGWSANLTANQLVYSAANPPSQQFQRFTLVIPGGEDSSNEPGGNSYGNITIDNLGTVTFTGVLADDSKAAQKTFLSRNGDWPFYISSANGLGVTLGWLTFSPGQAGTLGGQVYWDRLPGGSLYPNGFSFTNGIETSGSFYSFYIGRRSLNLTSCMMVLQQAGILPPITNYFTLSTKDTLTSTNGIKASINVVTGVFKGTIPAENGSIPVNGVVLQSQTNAFGFFINSGQSGSVFLGAPPQ